MKILLHSPASTVRRNGNHQTASEWMRMLEEAGHSVRLISGYEGEEADVLIALHAVKSSRAVLDFRQSHPDGKVIVALTGTDIYPAPTELGFEVIQSADALITLQKKAVQQVPESCREKVSLVIQSAKRLYDRPEEMSPFFDVCVIGHLRNVKDPLLAAEAARLLPSSSRIRILHAGGILEEKYTALVAREERQNHRYEWLGELSESDTSRLIASSRLMVLSSLNEGGARVVGEALVHGTPVLSTRIDGVEGLLEETYPGFFPVGDAKALSVLLQRCEEESKFYEALRLEALRFADQFSPERECSALLAAVEKVGENLNS